MSTHCPRLSIVIPVYNSEDTIEPLIEKIAALDIANDLEIILVNDGSKDGSSDICRRLVETSKIPITLAELSRNFGEHNAVLAGLRLAKGAYIIIMDDDFQNPPGEVVNLLEHAERTHADVVYTYYDKKQHSWWRNLGSRLTNWMADLTLDKPRGIYLSSFKCLNQFIAGQVTRYTGPYPYLDGLIFQVSQRIETIRVEHHARNSGESGYTFRKLVRLWLSMFINFSVVPLRVATIVGILVAVLGLIAAVFVVLEALFLKPTSGWGSLMAGLLVFSGVQLFMIGLMGEYVGRIFLTTNGKPQTVVRLIHSPGKSDAANSRLSPPDPQ